LGWQKKGFMILPRFFEESRIDDVNQSLSTNLTHKQKQDFKVNRLLNLFRTNKQVDNIFRDESLLRILSFILGKEALPFQTINFCYSSSQPAHSDAIHLTTEPLGYSLGVWVALEDVQVGSGEFFFYPGSHKLQYVLNQDFNRDSLILPTPDSLHKLYEKKLEEIISTSGLVQQTFLAKKGDILIWHTNLIHGSVPKQNNTLTRRSQIMHYFAKGVLCYHEMLEKPAVLH
jgi:ectoine hydroxylase-related dioxygenase (phytanoyl-CoA dioxygenase family)